MEPEDLYYYKWDYKLQLGDPNFADKLITVNYDLELAKQSPFPSDYILAEFANLAYYDKNYPLPTGWELLTTAYNSKISNGYFGVAFWNPLLCQVVISHRGTQLSNIGALLTDLRLSLNKAKVSQAFSAATFVHIIKSALKGKFYLSITGHSLGAWLAQISTFTCKYFTLKDDRLLEDENYLENVHPHTVVFESPGCREAIEKLHPRYDHRVYGNYNSLDMTVYLSKLNFINSVNEHIGTIYLVQSTTHSMKEILQLFNKENHSIQKEVLLDFRSGLFTSGKLLLRKIIPFCSSNKNVIKRPWYEHEYSLNVFNENELDFVKDWAFIKHNSSHLEQFQKEHSIPNFQVDYDYNVIISKEVNATIACIKHLKPTKRIIYDLLKQDIPEEIYFQILKMETQHFKRYLLEFQGYHFRDVYDLKAFIKSNDQILHIRVDEDTVEFELESSIVNNVISFYQKRTSYFIEDQYGFVKWQQLQQVLKFLPDVFEKYIMSFFIIECINCTDAEALQLLEFLKLPKSIKLVVITTDKFSWKNDVPHIREVTGFGNCIHFQDLEEYSQNKFIEEHNLKLCGKITNLKEIVNLTFPFTDEVYEKLNQAIPITSLLELMLTDSQEPIIMDCTWDNLLKPVIFIDLYTEVELEKVLARGSNERFLNVMQDEKGVLLGVQNVDNFENFCLSNPDKIVYLFTVKNGVHYLSKVFNKNLYISRRIICTKKVNPLLFSNLSDETSWFYFYGEESVFNNLRSFVKNELRYCLKFFNSKIEAKQMLYKAQNVTVHLLKIVDAGIFLRKSSGAIGLFRKYLGTKGKSITESELIAKKDVQIIVGEPGVGKSSLIASLSLQILNTHWVFVIQLNLAQFASLPLDNINFDIAADFITTYSNAPNPDVTKHLLSYCLKNDTTLPVCLMLDGYDEINEKPNRRKLISLINFLRTKNNTKIYITCRHYRCQELENGLNVFALQVEPLNYEKEMVRFFSEFWYSRFYLLDFDIENTLHYEEFACLMIQNAKGILGEQVFQLLGVPLHMRMIAEITTPQTSLMEIKDALTLYEKYVDIHYNIYFKRNTFKKNETIVKWLSDSITRKHYNFAVFKLFNLSIDSINYDNTDELNKVGLIHCDTNNDYSNMKFLYESIRDYFVAHLLTHWLESKFEVYSLEWDLEKFIVTNCLVKPEFKEVRLFLNLMLINTMISNDKLAFCRNNFKKLWEKDETLFFCDSEESVFHICIKENLYYLLKYFVLDVVVSGNDRVNLLIKRNNTLETPLLLALLQNDEKMIQLLLQYIENFPVTDIKTVLLSTFFISYVTVEVVDTMIACAKDFVNVVKILTELKTHIPKMQQFLDICQSNDYTRLVQLLDELRYDKPTRTFLMLVSNGLKETALHLTNDKGIVEILLKNGVNINARDHHGMTPLNRAIKRENSDIAKRLLEKGALNIPDLIGNSALIHAAKYNNFDVIRTLLNKSDGDIEQANIYGLTPLMIAAKNGNESIINYLLEKGANVNAADVNKMTSLFHAVKANQNNLIRILRQKGADVNVRDLFGTTPLLFSISKRLWNTVNLLLGNGADVNIGNSKRIFPLQLLIEMKQNNIIKKVMKEEIITTKGGGSIVREAANIDILSDIEKEYVEKLIASEE